jgi:hypothetical protein
MLKAIKGTEHIAAGSYSDGFALVLDCCRSFLQRGNPLGAIQGRATARLDRLKPAPPFAPVESPGLDMSVETAGTSARATLHRPRLVI